MESFQKRYQVIVDAAKAFLTFHKDNEDNDYSEYTSNAINGMYYPSLTQITVLRRILQGYRKQLLKMGFDPIKFPPIEKMDDCVVYFYFEEDGIGIYWDCSNVIYSIKIGGICQNLIGCERRNDMWFILSARLPQAVVAFSKANVVMNTSNLRRE